MIINYVEWPKRDEIKSLFWYKRYAQMFKYNPLEHVHYLSNSSRS